MPAAQNHVVYTSRRERIIVQRFVQRDFMPREVSRAVIADDDPQIHEDVYVHAVYDQIASHFSSTRYKVSV